MHAMVAHVALAVLLTAGPLLIALQVYARIHARPGQPVLWDQPEPAEHEPS